MSRRFPFRPSKLILPVVALGVLVYFIYHIINGNHGWLSWKHLEKELETSESTLEHLKEEQQDLQNKVSLMRPESLDEDMLDERVRTMLGTAKASEIIIIDDEQPPA